MLCARKSRILLNALDGITVLIEIEQSLLYTRGCTDTQNYSICLKKEILMIISDGE